MRRRITVAGLCALALIMTIAALPASGSSSLDRPQVSAARDDAESHSDNIRQIAEIPFLVTKDDPKTEEDEEFRAQGSDMAFEKNLMVAGAWQGFGVFRILNRPPYLEQLSFAFCPGPQGDISIWEDLVFVSVDTPQVRQDDTKPENGECDTKDASRQQVIAGTAWEGVRIFSIADPTRPKLVAAVEADCGSHTHTLLPAEGKMYLYIESYPLAGGLGPECNVASHRKNFIAEVPLDNPSKWKMVGSLDVTPSPGCHDVSFFPELKLAAAACLVETQLWSIEDPAQPTIISRIRNPFILHHSVGFTWDGQVLVIGDEFGGAAVGTGCEPSGEDSRFGAMWFYDISDPTSPQEAGHFGPPRSAHPDSPSEVGRHSCTNHQFTVLPMKDKKRYIASTSYYAAGISVVDFSDPADPQEIAWYTPDEEGEKPDTWAAYWYNGRIYTNDVNLSRAGLPTTAAAGIRVFQVEDLGPKQVNFYKDRLNPQLQIYPR